MRSPRAGGLAEGAGAAAGGGAVPFDGAGGAGLAVAPAGVPVWALAAVDHEKLRADNPAKAKSRGRAGPSIVGAL
jgi:hypothetical protein